MLNEAEIETRLERVCTSDVRQVVHELPGADRAQIADGVGKILHQYRCVPRAEIVCHCAAAVTALEENQAGLRLRAYKIKRKFAVTKDKLVDNIWSYDVPPACGDILRIPFRVDVAVLAGEECRAGIRSVAHCVLISPGTAGKQVVALAELMVDSNRVVLLSLERRSRPREVRGIESVSTGEVVRQWGLRDCIRNCTIESEPLRVVGYDVIGSQRDARHHVPRRVYRGAARPKGTVASSRNVAQEARAARRPCRPIDWPCVFQTKRVAGCL